MKRIATVPAEAFPSYASLAKLAHADTIILADTLPFNKRLKLNRFPLTGDQSFTLPLNAGRNYAESLFDPQSKWQRKLIHAIDDFYHAEPYFVHCGEKLKSLIEIHTSSYTDFVFDQLTFIQSVFGNSARITRASEFEQEFNLPALLSHFPSSTYLVEREFEPFISGQKIAAQFFEPALAAHENSAEELSLAQPPIKNFFSWGPYLSRLIRIA